MSPSNIEPDLKKILEQYRNTFTDKKYKEENDEHDPLMEVFGITPDLKREHRQYWGRELGMCWQRLVAELFRQTCSDYLSALQVGDDEPCDCIVGQDAIDTKYRIGSGDSGTLKKFKQYGKLLQQKGYVPILLIARDDNLPAAITACKNGGWSVYQGDISFTYIHQKSGFDLRSWLQNITQSKEFFISR